MPPLPKAMKRNLIFTFFLCSICLAKEFSIYTEKTIDIELNLYKSAVKFDLPYESFAGIEDNLHRAYVITGSLPLVTADHWMKHVTPAYFALNKMTAEEFKKQVQQLGKERRRTDSLVYDVRVRFKNEEYAVLAISHDSDASKWEKGMNL